MKKKKYRKKAYLRSVIVGFLMLYFVSMLLSTYFVKCKYEEDYNEWMYDWMTSIKQELRTLDEGLVEDTMEAKKNLQQYALSLLSKIYTVDQYQQVSAALYDFDGNLIAMTSNIFGSTVVDDGEDGVQQKYLYYNLADYMGEEEIEELAEYYIPDSHLHDYVKHDIEIEALRSYYFDFYYESGTEKPAALNVNERWGYFDVENITEWKEEIEEAVWTWQNENIWTDESEWNLSSSMTGEAGAVFPYLSRGKEYWEKWQQDEWLQSLADYDITLRIEEQSEEGLVREISAMELVAQNEANLWKLIVRQTAHPWLAACDYLKYVYIMGLLLTIVCIVKVSYSTSKTYKQREELENMRRDFTNAAAHELKTPLSVIRGFAENLKENTVEEKRDYYLDQIISQTEQMDNLVREMIAISKMDSNEMTWEKESISMVQVLNEQMDKLEAVIKEKNLSVICKTEEDFTLQGDKMQLGKMVWNLLSNAVEYNLQDGKIWITSDKNSLRIENTGNKIPEEQKNSVFDMFYTGDESRHERSKHLGLGLYLAKRICDGHGLKIFLINTDAGVKVVVSR